MPKNLVIVESPAKAKTIEKILGKDYTVKSSFGHVRDLEKSDSAVDIENDFAPKYVVTPDKKKVVKDLRDAIKKVDQVWLATDEDREGEAISWHLCEVLKLPPAETKRIVFREITAPAIQRAILAPRTVDINLVNAQQARRVLDRLVGYELSGLLWKKVKGGLSAGRVQSVALKLVVEREKEITAFVPENFFRVNALFSVENEQGKSVDLKAESTQRFSDQTTAEGFLKECIGATYRIDKIEVKPTKRRPTPPFTTSTLQQEASRKLYMNVKRTMSVAQRLYEKGLITYMRTDSTALSETAIQAIEQEINKVYGAQYAQVRRYKSKSANTQEAHEAIRPTDFSRHSFGGGDRDEERLYDLIWKRTVASQMADAVLEKTNVDIAISTVADATLRASGEVLKFEGFLKVYLESSDDDEDEEASGILPPLKEGQILPLQYMTATERFTRPPSRFTEAALVKQLEELGIGRPSTYAPTISKIMEDNRGYVIRDSRDGVEREFQVLTLRNDKIAQKTDAETTGTVKNRLFATDIGIAVSDFLGEHFKQIMDYGFTANVEEKFDAVAAGKAVWTDMLEDFYFPFHENVEQTLEEADRVTKERILGNDPETGRTILTRLSRRGPVLQLGAPEELDPEEKPRYANLPTGVGMDEVTLEQALELFRLPKTLGEYLGAEVVVGIGRYGPYVRWGDTFISLDRGEDPHGVDMDRAKELIVAKQKADAPVATYKGQPITKGKGRFGPFLKYGSIYVNVPKRYDFDNLKQDEIMELLEAKLEKEANRYIHQWVEEKIAVENGRWGPFIRWGKKTVNIPKVDGERMTKEAAADMTLDEAKAIIEAEHPDAFKAKKKAATKKTATKKKTTKTSRKKK